MTIGIGVELEMENALQDAQEIIELRGIDFKFYINDEDSVDRDIYGSIKKRTPTELTLQAFPVTYTPTDDQLKRAGIREQVDLMLTVATNSLTDNNISYADIDSGRYEVEFEGDIYLIKDKNRVNHFGSTYLNVVIGVNKK